MFVQGYMKRMASSFATRVLGNQEAGPASGFLHTGIRRIFKVAWPRATTSGLRIAAHGFGVRGGR